MNFIRVALWNGGPYLIALNKIVYLVEHEHKVKFVDGSSLKLTEDSFNYLCNMLAELERAK